MKKSIRILRATLLLLGFVLFLSDAAFAQKETRTNVEVKLLTDAGIITEFEKMLGETADPCDRNFLMTYLAPAAFNVGDKKKAKTYAQTLLTQVEKMGADCHSGKAVHVGNLILGRIALAAGNVAEAKRRLLEAGKTLGSPALSTFGPNMLLAEELFEKGERATVVEYLDLCTKFWDDDDDSLKVWSSLVKKGGYPDFGSNLRYYLEPTVEVEMLVMIRKCLKEGNLTKPKKEKI